MVIVECLTCCSRLKEVRVSLYFLFESMRIVVLEKTCDADSIH